MEQIEINLGNKPRSKSKEFIFKRWFRSKFEWDKKNSVRKNVTGKYKEITIKNSIQPERKRIKTKITLIKK